MDFTLALAPDAPLKTKIEAALALKSQGANGVTYLQLLLDAVQRLHPHNESLDADEQKLLGYGALSLGACTASARFNPANELHLRIKDWILLTCDSPHRELSGFGLYALGELNCMDEVVLSRLEQRACIESEFASDNQITRRAIAFRVLAKLNRSRAAALIDSPACREYIGRSSSLDF